MKDATEVIEGEVVAERSLTTWTPKFVVTVDEAVARHNERLDYLKRVLKEGTHYGVIPGTGNKPALLKPGAEALCADMGLRPDFLDDAPSILDFDGRDHNGEPLIFYQRRANLYRLHPTTGERVWVGAGAGSCTSWEDKYRWRTQVRTCPTCSQAAIIKGKAEYGGGWVCFKRKGGCGAKFPDGAAVIESQPLGRVPNDRVADLANTILKMADKRALVAAVLNTTGVSDLFTQDADDGADMDPEEHARMEASREVAAPTSTSPTSPHPTHREPAGPNRPPAPRLTAMTAEHVTAIRAAYKPLFAEKHPVIHGGWNDFMKAKCHLRWEELWSDDSLYAEAAEILGVGVPASTFDPDAPIPA